MLDNPLNTSRSNGIDTLRGLMALWVLFAHLIAWSLIIQGSFAVPEFISKFFEVLVSIFQSSGETHPAVLGFIVLSGYCIHRNGFRVISDRKAVVEYTIRRFFRIYPVYVLALFLAIVVYKFTALFSRDSIALLTGTEAIKWEYFLLKLTGISAFIPSFHFMSYQGNAPLLTVMVEIWLYVCYPLFLFLITRRHGEKRLWLMLSVIWIVGIMLVSYVPSWRPWWHNGSIFGFMLFWWIGVKSIDEKFISRLSQYKYFLIVFWAILGVLLTWVFPHFFILCEIRKIVFCLLFGLLVSHLDKSDVLIFRIGSVLGKGSYSIYACHVPLACLLIILGIPWWVNALMAIISGLLTFSLYEQPFIQFGKRFLLPKGTFAVSSQ